MPQLYLERFRLPAQDLEDNFFFAQKRTCYHGTYPFRLFPEKGLRTVKFAPITIFYGSNGSGKTTLLNLIAQKARLIRHSAFNGSAFFPAYLELCALSGPGAPSGSQILTSDDVFDYVLDLRALNDGIDRRREDLFREYLDRQGRSLRLRSMDDYEEFKDNHEAQRKTQSEFVRERLMRNVDLFSNGESAMRYFVEHITENALYLLDEPENSLSVSKQQELAKYLYDSARYFGCQFIISTHSPVILSIEEAMVYDLDARPVKVRPWTALENVRQYFAFFEAHREEFLLPKKTPSRKKTEKTQEELE